MKKVTRNSIRLTIRMKLISISLLLLLLPIISLGLTTYKVSVQETNELIESKLSSNVQLVIEMIENMETSIQKGLISREDAEESIKEMILGERSEDGSRAINPNIDLGQHGYFFVLNEKGDLITHPQLEGENIADRQSSDGIFYIKELIQAGVNGGGFTFYHWPLPKEDDSVGQVKEALKISYAKLSPSWGWIVSAGSYMQDYNSGQKNIFQAIITTLVICSVLGIILLIVFAQHLSKPILRIAQEAERIAEGDLSREALVIRNRDEVGQLGEAFNRLTDNMRHLIGNISLSSNSLNSFANQLTATTQETTQAIHHTAGAINKVANDNEIQAQSTQETAKAMEDMAHGISRVASSSSHAYELSIETLQEATAGNQALMGVSEQMMTVSETVNDLGASVAMLSQQSEQIGAIVTTIKNISGQTNLLALNAAIEASHAGEHGRGFAVVAGEVRKLAVLSNESAEQIAELIEHIRASIGHTTSSMEKNQQEVGAAVDAIEKTGETFSVILKATRSVVDQLQEASAAAQQMSASSEEVAASVLEIEQISIRTAGAAQNVSAAAEEQMASMDEINSSVGHLKAMSEQMKELAGKFKT